MSEVITQEIVEEFMLRMHLNDDEDGNLKNILEACYYDLKDKCGDYEMTDKRFKELVFERARYVYNDAVEYFDANFLSQINSLAVKKALESSDSDESEQV